jgi:hypothetical protein
MYRFVSSAVIAWCLASATALATVLIPAELGELARDADVVAHGRVISVEARQAEGSRRVERVVTLEVEQSLKGSATELVTFVSPGGELGRYRTVMVGAPEFLVGEEVVVFLRAGRGRAAHVLGLNQGVFRVATLGASGQRLVLSPVVVGAHPTEPVKVERGGKGGRAMPLSDFAQAVRAAAVERADPRGNR